MTKPNEKLVEFPRQSARDILTDVLRDGADPLLLVRWRRGRGPRAGTVRGPPAPSGSGVR